MFDPTSMSCGECRNEGCCDCGHLGEFKDEYETRVYALECVVCRSVIPDDERKRMACHEHWGRAMVDLLSTYIVACEIQVAKDEIRLTRLRMLRDEARAVS